MEKKSSKIKGNKNKKLRIEGDGADADEQRTMVSATATALKNLAQKKPKKIRKRPSAGTTGKLKPIRKIMKLEDLSEEDMNSSDETDDDDGHPLVDASDSDDEEEEEMANDFGSENSSNFEEEEASIDNEEDQETKPSKIQITKQRLAQRSEDEGRTVFVGNAPFRTTRKQIRQLFSPLGKIEAVYQRTPLQMTEKLTMQMMAKDKELEKKLTSTNFYVRYSQVEEAEKAVIKMQGTNLSGHTLRVTMSSKYKVDHKRSIFVGNLPFSATEEHVRTFFTQCGPVDTVRLLNNKRTGQNTGCGYVEFKTAEVVAKALKLNEKEYKGRQLRVTKVFKKKKFSSSNSFDKPAKMNWNRKPKQQFDESTKESGTKLVKKFRTKKSAGGKKRKSLIT